MPRVVPSQVVAVVDQLFPGVDQVEGQALQLTMATPINLLRLWSWSNGYRMNSSFWAQETSQFFGCVSQD